MARIRTIKPEFFTSEDIIKLSPHARLFYIGLWCEADRMGRLNWKPLTLKFRYLPADQVEISDIINELISAKLLITYEVDGENYAVIPKFTKHQLINVKEAQSKIPGINSDEFTDIHMNSHEFTEKTTGKGKEGKGKEGNMEGNGREGEYTPSENSENFIISYLKLKESLSGEIFQEQVCARSGFDLEKFKAFTERWLAQKEMTKDYMYPLPKMRSFLIMDFEKSLNGKGRINSKPSPARNTAKLEDYFSPDEFDEKGMLIEPTSKN
jgi:hypothetical protein